MNHRGLGLLLTVLLSACQASSGGNASERQLLNDFWQADSVAEREQAAAALLQANLPLERLYALLQAGPRRDDSAATGILQFERTGADGLHFPYMVLVPDDYDPQRKYPVEFMLHGGVSRPPWEPGQQWWRRGYQSLQAPDRITVVPASWNQAFWWFPNQAENLPEILRQVKQDYNVDENRVTLAGVSDGGTGAYFFAFRQPTHWAAFLPYIGHMAVLRNRDAGGGHALFFENLTAKPLYIVNGEADPLYPAYAVRPYIEYLQQAGVPHVFKAIFEGGHNTNWMPDELPQIEQFKQDNPRDPLPDSIQWITETTANYTRNHWLRIDRLLTEGRPGRVQVERQGNRFHIQANFVTDFTLLLSPAEVDFGQPVEVRINDVVVLNELVPQRADTLLKWAGLDLDRTMLFTAELPLHTPE